MRVHVLTISDRAADGAYEDKSGAEIENLLREAFPESIITRELIPDEGDMIRGALMRACGRRPDGTRSCDCAYARVCTKMPECYAGQTKKRSGINALPDFILTTGGTGISPRDVTPEATAAFCEKELPGVAETLRAASFAETDKAMLSRAYAGVYGQTIIVNFPGSARASRLCVQTLIPIMEHAAAMLRGGAHAERA